MTKKFIIIAHVLVLMALFSNPRKWVSPAVHKVAIHLKNHSFSTQKQKAAKVSKPQNHTIAKTVSKPEVKKQVAKKKPQQAKKQPPKAEKKSQAKPIASSKSESPKIQEKETIAKIAEKIDKLESITQGEIKQQPSTTFDTFDAAEQGSFSKEDVALYLFELLELPGPGKVSVQLKLDLVGKIEDVVIIDSENPENSLYLLKELKDLILPFGKNSYVPATLKVCFSNLKA